jgi:hypothetical protein
MAVYVADIIEPARPGVDASSLAYGADNTIWPTADGGLLTGADDVESLLNVIEAEVYEPVHRGPGADTTLYTADETVWPTADGGIIEGATETVDAVVNAAIIFAGIYEYPIAADDLDAAVEAAPAYGRPYYPQWRLVPVEAAVYEPARAVAVVDAEVVPATAAGDDGDDDDEIIAVLLLLAA